MPDIFDLPSGWRFDFVPASFRGAPFYCEANAVSGGQRIVEHEFPKKNTPYAEFMGKHAYEYSIRGYCIAFPYDTGNVLKSRDYRPARDLLRRMLDEAVYGTLQIPFQQPVTVACSGYRVTEEEKFGGYCVFDMTFLESGIPPPTIIDYVGQVASAATAARNAAIANTDTTGIPSAEQKQEGVGVGVGAGGGGGGGGF
jgi:prophage DNA circulation protein